MKKKNSNGKPKPSSDVDLFIIKESNLPQRFLPTKREAFPLDVLVYPLKERRVLGDFFIKNIFKI